MGRSGERGALVEAGAIFRAKPQSEHFERADDRHWDGDGEERDHGMQYRTKVAIAVYLIDFNISR
jgi:hypothetical protein